jgi:ABC-type antimicrobial peptide transport system ATPase subunit
MVHDEMDVSIMIESGTKIAFEIDVMCCGNSTTMLMSEECIMVRKPSWKLAIVHALLSHSLSLIHGSMLSSLVLLYG